MLTKKAISKTFIELVKIDSPSGQEQKVAQYIIKYLKKLGIKTRRDKFGNLVAKLDGIGKPILLSAHMDTVEPGKGIEPIIKKDVISSRGDTILGADDKAGIAIILETIQYLVSKRLKHRAVELLFTRQEEVGLLGAFNLNTKLVEAREGLLFDGGGAPGEITLAAPYIYDIDIEVYGRSAHSGVEPEKGISAVVIAAKAIAEVKTGRINSTTTVNFGKIDGGSTRNTVPALVKIKAEARSHKQETALRQVDIINKAFKKAVRQVRGRLKFKSTLACQGYVLLRSDKFVKEIVDMNRKMRFKTRYVRSGGVTDASALQGKGIKMVNISMGAVKYHTTKERVRISHLLKVAEFTKNFLTK